MFQLVAIRPLQGCFEYIRKCLKEGTFYYFNDRYQITEDGTITLNMDRRGLISDFYKIYGSHTHISFSAIVGKNGDGKSSIVEMMLRLINNYTLCVKELTHEDVNPTVTVKGVAAELYFRIDATIYRLYDERGDGQVRLRPVARTVKGKITMIQNGEGVDRPEQLPDKFFYTMVSNFSHYSYNVYDFRREWVPVSAKTDSDDSRCWLYYIFHKNDGYRSPLVLNPFRDKGNVNVNNEAYLNNQRLISLFIDADEPTVEKPTFRRLYEKTARYVTLKDPGESKLQQKTIVEHFMACRKDELLTRWITLAKEMGKDSKVLEANKADCLHLLRLIQTSWIHSNEELLDAIKEWNRFVMKRAEGEYEDAGFLSEKSDFAMWLDEMEKLVFGDETEDDEIDRKRLLEGFRPFRTFNLAQLQMIGLVRYVCDLMAGRDESFVPGEDQFDLTVSEIVKPYKDLTRKQKCEHYIIYKIIAIFETYIDEYHKPCRGFKSSQIGNATIAKSLVSRAINDLWWRIKNKPSHSNLKLRQALYYMKNGLRSNAGDIYTEMDLKGGKECCMVAELLDKKIPPAERTERLVLPLDALRKSIPDTKNLQQLPPPIYFSEIVYVPDGNDEEVITGETLSSGERQRLASLSSVIYHLRNLNSKREEDIKYRNVNVVLEEIELYFHPESQRMFVKELIEMIERAGFNEIDNIHILLVTHSPFILSDIPKGNVMLLKGGKQAEELQRTELKTFCANIFQLLDTGFFMERGAIGEFSKYYINRIISGLNAWWDYRHDNKKDEDLLAEYPLWKLRTMIDLIDDQIIKESLMTRFEGVTGESMIDEEIRRLKKQIEELETIKERQHVVSSETN